MTNKLIKKFKDLVFREKLIAPSDKIVIGISGGSDSVALATLLLSLQKSYQLNLHLVHINYHLRGQESEEDEIFVEEFAQKNYLPLEVIHYQPANSKSRRGNLEERLRDFRYQAFEKIRQAKKFNWLAVGHQRDDQTETFLLNLFRGAGLKGLAGMKLKDETRKIIRPLLRFSKKELQTFLRQRGEKWREDSSNQNNDLFRNKIRNELIPLLEKEYSSNFGQKINQTSQQLADCHQLLENLAKERFSTVVNAPHKNEAVIALNEFLQLPKSLQAEIFRQIITTLRGDLLDIDYGHFREFNKLVNSCKGKNPEMLFKQIKIIKRGNQAIFSLVDKA